jgi:hypothetical protein
MHSRHLVPFVLILCALDCGGGTGLAPADGSLVGVADAATGGTSGSGGSPVGTGGSSGGAGGGGCGPVCAIYCANGNVLDGRGCPTCACKPPPDGGGATDVTLADAACGTQVEVKVGARVTVSLGSTYWTIQGSSSPAVLQSSGAMTHGPGQNCPPFPGSGCGTVSMVFQAVGAGQAVISASRTTCGEALQCGHGQGMDQCTITVVVN